MDWVMQWSVVLQDSNFHEVKNTRDFIIIYDNKKSNLNSISRHFIYIKKESNFKEKLMEKEP